MVVVVVVAVVVVVVVVVVGGLLNIHFSILLLFLQISTFLPVYIRLHFLYSTA